MEVVHLIVQILEMYSHKYQISVPIIGIAHFEELTMFMYKHVELQFNRHGLVLSMEIVGGAYAHYVGISEKNRCFDISRHRYTSKFHLANFVIARHDKCTNSK